MVLIKSVQGIGGIILFFVSKNLGHHVVFVARKLIHSFVVLRESGHQYCFGCEEFLGSAIMNQRHHFVFLRNLGHHVFMRGVLGLVIVCFRGIRDIILFFCARNLGHHVVVLQGMFGVNISYFARNQKHQCGVLRAS